MEINEFEKKLAREIKEWQHRVSGRFKPAPGEISAPVVIRKSRKNKSNT